MLDGPNQVTTPAERKALIVLIRSIRCFAPNDGTLRVCQIALRLSNPPR